MILEIMKIKIILFVMTIMLIPISYANAQTGDLELTLENIEITPLEPKEGDLVTITTEIHNTGKINTGSVASIVTVAFFINDKLVDVKDTGDIKTGVQNKIQITSKSIPIVDSGEYTIKAVVNYHNTIGEQLDLPDGNIIEKLVKIESLNSTNIFLTTDPKYGFQDNETVVKITAILTDGAENYPLTGKKIVLSLEGNKIELFTDKEGMVLFEKTNNFSETKDIKVLFEGDDKHATSSASSSLYSFPNEIKSAIIVEIQDENDQYHFTEFPLKMIVFQESYENIVREIIVDSTILLDSKTFFVEIPPGNNYFAEVYVDGEFFVGIEKEDLEEKEFTVKEIKIPESALIRFNVINEEGLPIKEGIVKIGTKLEQINNGITDWIDIIPITGKQYFSEIVLPNRDSIESESFKIFPEERKTITIQTKELVELGIPDWIKNNAAWWAEGNIDDKTFVQGIQFMVKQGIIKIPPITQNSDLNSNKIPDWIKNNAAWWAEGNIDDKTFVQGIQFMVKQGIIRV